VNRTKVLIFFIIAHVGQLTCVLHNSLGYYIHLVTFLLNVFPSSHFMLD